MLPKSYSEFKEQLQWADMSHFQLLEAYMDYESQRERKLMAAKEERCRLKQTKLLFERPKSVSVGRTQSKYSKSPKEQVFTERVMAFSGLVRIRFIYIETLQLCLVPPV